MAKGVTPRRLFSDHPTVVGQVGGHPSNRGVTSKSVRRYGANETTGENPGELYRDPVNGDSPVTHHNAIASHHVETVGWMDGSFNKATHPNAEAKAAGNARRTHGALEPVGQTHSKYGGEHGKPQSRPQSDIRRGAKESTPQLAKLNRDRQKGR